MLKFGFELGSILGNVRRIKMRLPYNQDGTGKTSIHTLQHILVETALIGLFMGSDVSSE